MKNFILPLITVSALALPATAQDTPADDFAQDFERFSEEAQRFFGDLAQNIAPMLEGLQEKIGDLSHYDAPEVLPNGDIIIRRKPDAPKSPPPQNQPNDGQVDL